MNVPFERVHASVHRDAMIAWLLGLSADTAGRVTDFNDGAVVKTLLETVAIRFEHLDAKAFEMALRAIPEVLYDLGEGDGVTTFTGFPALPAIAATGLVRFERNPNIAGDIPIELGAELRVPAVGAQPERLYRTIVPVTLRAGETFAETLAEAATPGTVGNTSANTMVLRSSGLLLEAITGIASATNPQAFLNGAEAETAEGRRARFQRYIRNLGRAQLGGLERGALRAQVLTAGIVSERALFARATRVPDKRGLVDVVIDNGGAGATPALVADAQAIIDGSFTTAGARVPGYKAAGETVLVKAVVPQIVAPVLTIALDPGYTFPDVTPLVRMAVEQQLFGLGVFQDLVLADLICAVASVRGVKDVTFTTPTANLSTLRGARIMPGAVTITQA